MRALTAPLQQTRVDQPVPHTAYSVNGKAHAAELGLRRQGPFSGTDALSMAIQPQVLEWLDAGPPYPLLVAEGDRLANAKFFDAVMGMGYELAVLHVWAAEDVLAARRAGRAGRQSATWVQGRASKVRNLAGRYSAFPLEARQEPRMLATGLAALPGAIGSMVRELRGGRDGARGRWRCRIADAGGAAAGREQPISRTAR